MSAYDDLISKRWILTKWDHSLKGMCEFYVRITGLYDGPDGSTWATIEGEGLDREIAMPLHRFEQQARPVKYPYETAQDELKDAWGMC